MSQELIPIIGAAIGRWSLIVDKHSATAGQDRRKIGETCVLLLAPAGGESPDPPSVRGNAPPNLGATDPGGLTPDVD